MVDFCLSVYTLTKDCVQCECSLKANVQSVEFSERAEILLFTRENVALKLNRLLRLSNISFSKIPPAWDVPLTGNWPLVCFIFSKKSKKKMCKNSRPL